MQSWKKFKGYKRKSLGRIFCPPFGHSLHYSNLENWYFFSFLFDPPGQNDTSDEEDPLPPSHHGWTETDLNRSCFSWIFFIEDNDVTRTHFLGFVFSKFVKKLLQIFCSKNCF